MGSADVLEVLDVLTSHDVDVSIEGGWGVDALVGEQTREHVDLDLAVDRKSCGEAVAILNRLGFEVDSTAEPAFPARLVLGNEARQVDFHPLLFDEDGNGWQQLTAAGGWLIHPAKYLWRRGQIGGRPVKCIAAELQLVFRLGYVWSERDEHDLRLLRAKCGIPLPPDPGNLPSA